MAKDSNDRTTQDAFTRPRGAPKTSPHTRPQQLARAQKRRREALKKAGLVAVTVYLTPHRRDYLRDTARRLGLTQGEYLDGLLARARGGGISPEQEDSNDG